MTGSGFHYLRDELQESCVASGKSSDQCKCDIQGLSDCVGVASYREPRCDLFQCCQSETGDNDESRNDCFLQDEAQQRYDVSNLLVIFMDQCMVVRPSIATVTKQDTLCLWTFK